MVRRKRNWRPNVFFHVIMNGNNRQNIFATNEDMYHLLRIITHSHLNYSFKIIAYCIMSNHYHLLISSKDNLAKIMQQINRRYSDYYSKRYKHVGRIYQKRYYSKEVVDPTSLLITSRYIHRNPLETNTPMVKNLEDYPFSSFPTYAGKVNHHAEFLDITVLPNLLKRPFAKTTKGYTEYCLVDNIENLSNAQKVIDSER